MSQCTVLYSSYFVNDLYMTVVVLCLLLIGAVLGFWQHAQWGPSLAGCAPIVRAHAR
jgi:UDP-N-acetylmuramyl pentapeptide phosphotransferase/UDP-N-acetylglucosamine-1-phosphate transferase